MIIKRQIIELFSCKFRKWTKQLVLENFNKKKESSLNKFL